MSLRELWFDKRTIVKEIERSKRVRPTISSLSILSKKNNDSQVKKKVRFKASSIIKIREDLKDLAKDKKSLEGSYQYSKFKSHDEDFFQYENENPFKIKTDLVSDEYFDADDDIEEYNKVNIIHCRPKKQISLIDSPNSSIIDILQINKKQLKLKILIVDDDSTQRLALERILKSILNSRDVCFEIISASDGVEALNKIMTEINKDGHNNPIRCIIMDENMKYLNGSKTFGIINQIKSFTDYLKDACLISLSSHYSNDFEEYLKKLGCNYCITKPIEKSFLKEIIKIFWFKF